MNRLSTSTATRKDMAMKVFMKCEAVCFDVDSTVIQEEGIDELAAYVGKRAEIAALTKQAMGGKMTFREALEMRLNIIQPTRQQVHDMSCSEDAYTLTPGIRELVALLHHRGVDVYLVSGGFRALIKPIAEELNIPLSRVYANRILFNNDGSYAGFDKNQPTSSAGGKPLVVQALKEQRQYRNVAFIGDGVTDLEASPPADIFIGFGGNCVRDTVKAKAKWYVYDFKEIIDSIKTFSTSNDLHN